MTDTGRTVEEGFQQQKENTTAAPSSSLLSQESRELEHDEGIDMESKNREVREALLSRDQEEGGNERGEDLQGSAAILSSAAGREICGMAVRKLVPIILLIGVVAFVSFTAGQKQLPPNGEEDTWGPGRPLKKLEKPTVILISADGFRWSYNYKVPTPNIDRLRLNGTEAERGLIPVYPSLTFPNHYSIATGLYPAWHGIIANHFSDPEFKDPRGFDQSNHDPKWWGGEPIWVTVTKNGLRAATYFWPGSEVLHGPWTCDPTFCQQYNGSVPYEERVDTVLGYMDLPPGEIPSFISLYFESPDHEGHEYGPDSPQVATAIEKIDSLVGRLISGLEKRGVFEDVTIILLGDHGMAPNCDSKMIYLEDLGLGSDLNSSWVDSAGAFLSIRPPPEVDAKGLYEKMAAALSSGKVQNSEFLKLYLKEDLPERLHYSHNDRIEPIIGMPMEGFKVSWSNSQTCGAQCGGQHGYDNQLLSMRTIFFAHGPQFARGRVVPSFMNVEIYNVLVAVLDLKDAASGLPIFLAGAFWNSISRIKLRDSSDGNGIRFHMNTKLLTTSLRSSTRLPTLVVEKEISPSSHPQRTVSNDCTGVEGVHGHTTQLEKQSTSSSSMMEAPHCNNLKSV
ncbi:hypothetical protein R1flu_012872 [Riccia fluitans]|uniref:Uncharacterized protein n=1 Tax=Riccia fluitans TaxID=41844 RepID=A0ABD1ZBT7_9MARC